MAKRFFFIFLLTIFHFTGFSSSENYNFRRITTNDGLSNSWVRCFFQDDLGFIWVGTSDGLNRYDGINMKVYRPTTINNSALGNVTINDIIKKNDQCLWIATDLGLFEFNYLKEQFTLDTLLSPNPVTSIETDGNQNFWFGTNHGLFHFNQIKKQFSAFNYKENDNTSLSNDYINVLKFDSHQRLWVGTKKGLNLIDIKNKNLSRINQNTTNEIFEYNILAISEDNQHRIWIGTASNGLNLITSSSNQFQFNKVLDGTISSLLVENNILWIGSASGEGIRLLDLKKFIIGATQIVNLQNNPLINTSLSENSSFCLFADSYNDIWIGTYGKGVNFFSRRAKPFLNVSESLSATKTLSNNLVNAFYEDEDYLWIGTENGLNRLNKKTEKFDHFYHKTNDHKSLGSNTVTSLFRDSHGILWVGTWAGGLNQFDEKTNSFRRFLPEGKPNDIGSTNISSIYEDKFHNLWIGTTGGGLNLFHRENDTFTIYKKDANSPTSLAGRSMSCLMQTRSGDFYIALYSTFDRFDYSNKNFEHIQRSTSTENNFFQKGNINLLFEDSKENFWLGTDSGLELYDRKKKTFSYYTTNEGLPDNSVQAILEDDRGNLWISTNNGISKFNNAINLPVVPVFTNYTNYDGLPANDFKRRAAYKNKQGLMYFGSSNGYTYFHPDSIQLNENEPTLVFTNFQILESIPNKGSKYRSLQTNLNHNKNIELHYPNTNFIISFAALNFLNAKKNKYKYKLEGYDTEWIDANESMSATYTNIKQGRFTFMVIGANNDGVWSKQPISIDIIIYPPWWNTLLFKLFVFVSLFLAALVFIVTRFTLLNNENKVLEAKVEKRTTELLKLNRLLEEKQTKISLQNYELEKHRNQLEELVNERTVQLVAARAKAEESDKLKSAFLANMSHEIRTPMNAIIGFSRMLNDSYITDEKRDKYIEHIKTNGNMLTILINDIIDISLIEANQMKLSLGKFNVDTILTDLYQYFELEKNKDITLKYIMNQPGNDLFLYNDAIRFRQIMVNLLSNAFKYSDSGTIKYGYQVLESKAQFFVSDNGIGMEQEELSKIFDHFYKSFKEKSKLYRGTGIGLAICKKLVEQMGGEIWVESKIKVGSTFYFTLPLIISE